ncbi:MAG TPA: ionic transporter y4hA [Terracidiphilus sp.]
MTVGTATSTPWWAWAWPLLAWMTLALQLLGHGNVFITVLEAFALIATVFAAVYHAEVVAHKIGEPFGSLVLALAVTIIEVALIVSVMITGIGDSSGLARDTIFAAVMIVCNGIVGMCLLGGGVRHKEQDFQLQGAKAAMSVLIALTALSMVFPNVTTTTTGPTYSVSQLIFAAIVSLVLYGSFLFVQTIRHRDYFLPVGAEEEHAAPPQSRVVAASAALLLIALVAIVGLAKVLTPTVERAIARAGAPESVVGVVIAALVLLPEGLAAFRSSRANRLQISMNLALGSALASIGLTIPAVAMVSIFLHKPLTLGLEPKEIVLLFVSLILSQSTLGTGRTTVLQGIVHLVIFAAFLFLTVVP